MTISRRHTFVRRAGFTLVEVMVSVALIATAFVSLLVLQRQTVSSHVTVQAMTIASMIAEDRLERAILRAQGFQTVDEYNPDLDRNYPNFEVDSQVEDVGPDALPVVALLPEGLTIKRVTVVVRWAEGQRKREYKLEHFVTVKLT